MSRWHRTTRRDANHGTIVSALKAIGASVIDLAAVGGGCPDLLVGFRSRNVLLEVKNPERKTRGDNAAKTLEKQAKFRAEWRGDTAVVDSVEAAVREVSK